MLIGAMNHPAEDPVSEIKWMAELGLEFVDLTVEPPAAASWRIDTNLIRRVLADVEANAKLLRDKQGVVEIQILAAPAESWPEAVAKARYVLNLYAAGLAATDTHHRDLVAAVLADFARLSVDET